MAAPVGGWNPDVNPWDLPATEAPVLDNFLVRPGKIIIRGGFKGLADLNSTITLPLDMCGAALNRGQILLGRKNKSASGQVDPWNAPLLGASAAVLASGLTGMLYVSNTGLVTQVTAVNADEIIGPRWVNFDGLLYGLSYDSAGSTLTDAGGSYFMKPCSLLTLNNTSLPIQPAQHASSYANITFASIPWTISGGPYVTLASGQGSDFLGATGFGFPIASGATIQGIQLNIVAANGSILGSAPGPISDELVTLMKAGSPVGSNKATNTGFTNQPTSRQYGGPSDLWGTTWSVADITNTNFGVAFQVQNTNPGGPPPEKLLLYDMVITVYYTLSVSTPLPTVFSNAPHGAFDVHGHLQRIWLLGGIDTPGGGGHHSATTLFFTNPIASGGGSSTSDWQDPVSGLTNQLKMDNNSADYGVALGHVRNGLVILRRSSVWLLKGTTTANFVLGPASLEDGCLDARSVVETDSGLFFIGRRGLMLTDGVKVTNESTTVMRTLQEAIALEQTSLVNGTGGYITSALTSQGQIIITIGAYSPSGHRSLRLGGGGTPGSVTPIWCGMFDPTVKGGAWVRLTSSLYSDGVDATQDEGGLNNYPGLLLGQINPHQIFSIGDRFVTMLEDETQNYSFLLQSQLYDSYPPGYASSLYTSIPALWTTRDAPIIGTSTRNRNLGLTRRFFIDHVFSGYGIVPSVGWTVVPVDATGTQIEGSEPGGSTLQTGVSSTVGHSSSISGGPDSPALYIERQNQDFISEVSELGFTIMWADPTNRTSQPMNVVSEIYGLGVEFQGTREQR